MLSYVWRLHHCTLHVLISLSRYFVTLLSAVFYSLPSISEFIIDVVVGSPQEDIRDKAVRQFLALSWTPVSPTECTGHQLTPRQFLLQTLLKARLPFWVSSTVTRGASYRSVTFVCMWQCVIEVSNAISYPISRIGTNKYWSFIHFALAKYD